MSTVAIGICAAIERVRWGAWDATVTMAPRSYATAVQASGAIALIVPPDPAADRVPADFLDRVDGLILAGGADVDPSSYGAEPHPATKGSWPERDRFELALAREALERELPLLGICRGMQMLNVACSGTIEQHLPDVVGHEDHRPTPGTFSDHEVSLAPGSLAARAVGAEQVAVKSHHHQGVRRLGEGLAESGWAEPDGVVEAIELPDRRFALGVLWHPEEDVRSRVVGALAEAARTQVPAR